MAIEQMSLDQAIEEHSAGLLGGAAPEGAPAEQPEAAADVSDAPAQSEETTGDVADSIDGDAEVSEGETSEATEETQEETEDRFVFTIDGEEVEFTAASLQENLVRQKVLDERLQKAKEQKYALADETRKRQEEVAQTIAERQQYLQALESMRAKFGAIEDVPEPDESLRHTDPLKYQDMKLAAIERRDQIRQIEERQREVAAKQRADEERQFAEFQTAKRNELVERVPDWQDASRLNRDIEDLGSYAVRVGGVQPEKLRFFTAGEIILLRKAKMYDDLMENQQSVVAKKVQQAAPTIKQGRTLKSKPKDATQKANDAFVKAANSGSLDVLDKAVDAFLAASTGAKR